MDHLNGTPAKSNRKKDPIGKLFALMFFMLITFQLVKRALACLPTFQLVVVVASLNLFLRGEIWRRENFYQEYERSVIFRLGRLLSGGARGPGVFFILPCVDTVLKIDMRSRKYEIPPQKVFMIQVIE